jgi:hypothetical protein
MVGLLMTVAIVEAVFVDGGGSNWRVVMLAAAVKLIPAPYLTDSL